MAKITGGNWFFSVNDSVANIATPANACPGVTSDIIPQKNVISSKCREILLDMQKNESICVERVDGKKYKKGSFFIKHNAKETIFVQLSTRKNGMDE